jgi:hypothetical protein
LSENKGIKSMKFLLRALQKNSKLEIPLRNSNLLRI